MHWIKAGWRSLFFAAGAWGVGLFVVAGAAFVIGFWQDITHFPRIAQVLLGLAALLAILLLIANRQRLLRWAEGLTKPKAETGGGISQKLADIGGGSHNINFSGNIQRADTGGQPVLPVAPLPSTPAILRERGTALKKLGDRLAEFASKAEAKERDGESEKWQEGIRESQRRSQEIKDSYVTEFDADVAFAYQDAHSRGFSNPDLDRDVETLATMSNTRTYQEVARALRVIGLQMLDRAKRPQ
jgi:membrane protein implicated in regulation of membrane protease activity